MTIEYVEDTSPSEVLDFVIESLAGFRQLVDATIKTAEGLNAGPLSYESKSALIVAELVAHLQNEADDCLQRIVVDLSHMATPPPANEIARAAGISPTRLRKILADAIPLSE